MILEFFRKRRARKLLEKYVSKSTARKILSGDIDMTPPLELKPGHIEFVFAFVRGDSPKETGKLVGTVMEIALLHHATIENVLGPLIILTFGLYQHEPHPPRSRMLLVEHLSKEFSDHIKILHGAADGHHGLVGGGRVTRLSFLVPNFNEILGTLSHLDFGQTEEYR